MNDDHHSTRPGTSDSDPACLIKGTGNSTEFQCPRCPDQRLDIGEIGQFQVCFCTGCLGFVIDSASFATMVRTVRAGYTGPADKPEQFERAQLRVRIDCPACRVTMQTHPYYGPGNVVLDSCPHCVLNWLDHHELNRIMRAEGQR